MASEIKRRFTDTEMQIAKETDLPELLTHLGYQVRRIGRYHIFSLIRAIGLILLGFGILQVGLSLKSHDPSQRANGMLTLAGGIVITFTKEILTLITG